MEDFANEKTEQMGGRSYMKEMIKSSRLFLCPLSLEELYQLQEGRQDFLKKSVLSDVIQAAIRYKIDRMKLIPTEVHPWISYWQVIEAASGQGIGLIGCKNLPDEIGYVELGYAMAEEYRNCGYMTEALDTFLDWLYEYPFVKGVKLRIRGSNVPSVRVALKCGFQYEWMQDVYRVYHYDFSR